MKTKILLEVPYNALIEVSLEQAQQLMEANLFEDTSYYKDSFKKAKESCKVHFVKAELLEEKSAETITMEQIIAENNRLQRLVDKYESMQAKSTDLEVV